MASPIKPEPGLVLRFDFLFDADRERGRDSGKDRPVAVVVVVPAQKIDGQTVIVAPITHSPPVSEGDGIALPAAVARHLGLDNRPMWIKTHELNRFVWRDNRFPFGLQPVDSEQWHYGYLPPRLLAQLKDAVLAGIKSRRVRISKRD